MKIDMVDLRGQYNTIQHEIDAQIQEVLNTSAFINGPQVKTFCKHLAEYNRIAHVIPCGNGTDALQIALMSLGLQRGDEVIVPVFTYAATAEVIALLGLTPVFIDCESNYFSLDTTQLESKITPQTKAIVPVHLYGQCSDMETILQIARKYGLFVVEDTAQSIGAEYRFSDGHIAKAGCMGDIGTTSFFPSKNLGCYGDGGALLTKNEELAQKALMIANHGQNIKYHHDIVGCNSRLDTLQAAILDVKLKYIDKYIDARNKVADYYDAHLTRIPNLILPQRSSSSSHVFHQYTIRVTNNLRDKLKKYLADKQIPSMIYYPIPLHQQKAYSQHCPKDSSFPIAVQLCQEVLSLPIHTEMTLTQLDYIVKNIQDFFHYQ